MKRRLIVSVFVGVLLSGCATHYYQIDGNDMVLVLRKPQAKNVELVCSLDEFKIRKAQYTSGRWEVTLPANRAFKYFYRLNGEPFIPDCPLKENDDYGSQNCIFDPHM